MRRTSPSELGTRTLRAFCSIKASQVRVEDGGVVCVCARIKWRSNGRLGFYRGPEGLRVGPRTLANVSKNPILVGPMFHVECVCCTNCLMFELTFSSNGGK